MGHWVATLEEGRHNLSPVKQYHADGFLLLMISVFGVTVIVIRIFLELTGYPQVGDSTFHIAHVLWGGLLLFVAVVIGLIFSNPWAHWAAAILGGIGAGLFIDEVGKFITQKNDYFYPLAFPIIYAFFVSFVWFYFRVRRSNPRDTRTLFYHAVDLLKEAFDDDLDLAEHDDLVQALKLASSHAAHVSERKLAADMLEFVRARTQFAQIAPGWFDEQYARVRAFLLSTPSRTVLKIGLNIGFFVFAVNSFAKLFGLYVLASGTAGNLRAALSKIVIVSGKSEYMVGDPLLLPVNSVLLLIMGLLSITSTVLLWRGDERPGLRLGTLALVFALTIINPLTFYFSQLYAIVDALGQLLLIGLAQLYRWRFFLQAQGATRSVPQVPTNASA